MMALQIVPASTDYGDAYIPPDITLDITESDGLEFEGESNLYDSSDNLIRQDKFKGESSLQYTVPLIDAWHDMKDGGYKVDVNVSAEVPIPPTPISLIPSQSGTLTYNGSYQVPTFVNYNPEELQINGTDTAVDAGTYTVTFTPKQGYCWADGSVGAVSVQWMINKANNPMTLSDYTYSIEEKKQYVFTITINNKVGNVTYTNKEGATVNLTGNTLRFTVNGSLITKNIVIPITDEGNNNYYPVTHNFTIINAIPDETLGIHLLGGNSSYGTSKNHYVWDRNDYKKVSTLPFDMDMYTKAIVYNNEIHIFGGTKHYKWNGDEWISESVLPISFKWGIVISYNDEIHMIEYYNTTASYHYKYNGSSWQQLENAPYIIESNSLRESAVVYNNEIHIINSAKHFKYNGVAWTRLNDHGLTIGYNSIFQQNIFVHNQKLKVNTSKIYSLNGLYVYDDALDKFSKEMDSPIGGDVVIFDNQMHILGGQGTTDICSQHLYYYKSVWTNLKKIPYLFQFGSAVVYKNPKKNEPITTLPSQSNLLIFNGQTQMPTWNNFDETKMTIGGTVSSVNAGTFEATFTPKDGYCWSDESTTAKTITWTINKASFEIDKTVVNMNIGETTSVIMTNFPIYDHYPEVTFNATDVEEHLGVVIEWNNVKETDMTQCAIKIKVHDSGSTYGHKQITFTSGGNSNYSAGTQTVDVIVGQSSQPLVISKLPVQTGLYTHSVASGTQGPVWDVEDANIATIAANTGTANTGGLRIMSGQTAARYANTYTVYWKPQNGYSWWDGSTASKTSTWTITSAQQL